MTRQVQRNEKRACRKTDRRRGGATVAIPNGVFEETVRAAKVLGYVRPAYPREMARARTPQAGRAGVARFGSAWKPVRCVES
jgi:hypothetical protein